jgi:hypothetical protein
MTVTRRRPTASPPSERRRRAAPVPVTTTAETWSLFTDRDAVERVMTEVVRQGVQSNHGVEIPAGVPQRAEAR